MNTTSAKPHRFGLATSLIAASVLTAVTAAMVFGEPQKTVEPSVIASMGEMAVAEITVARSSFVKGMAHTVTLTDELRELLPKLEKSINFEYFEDGRSFSKAMNLTSEDVAGMAETVISLNASLLDLQTNATLSLTEAGLPQLEAWENANIAILDGVILSAGDRLTLAPAILEGMDAHFMNQEGGVQSTMVSTAGGAFWLTATEGNGNDALFGSLASNFNSMASVVSEQISTDIPNPLMTRIAGIHGRNWEPALYERFSDVGLEHITATALTDGP